MAAAIKKPLFGRRLEVASGLSDLPYDKVVRLRNSWAENFILPDMPQWPAPVPVVRSNAGTTLHAIIFRETGVDIPCPVCAEEIEKLNMLTVVQAAGEKDRIVEGILGRAWGNAGWTDKLKLLGSMAVSAGTIGMVTPAASIIGGWFDEAIEAGSLPAAQKKKAVEPIKEMRLREVEGVGLRREGFVIDQYEQGRRLFMLHFRRVFGRI